MAIVQRTKTYAVCPTCGKDAGTVDHLLNTTTRTAWYCDACGHRYHLEFHTDGHVDIWEGLGRRVPTVDILVLPPQEKPVYFVVEGGRFEDPTIPDDCPEEESKEFYYESHSCPTNWLDPIMVYHDGDTDPHGLIQFVLYADRDTLPPDETWGPNPYNNAVQALIERSIPQR
jgi:hypothetical protein